MLVGQNSFHIGCHFTTKQSLFAPFTQKSGFDQRAAPWSCQSLCLAQGFVSRPYVHDPCHPPRRTEHHSRHLWMLCVYLCIANIQPVIRVPLSPVDAVILYLTHQLHSFVTRLTLFPLKPDIHSGCIDRQKRNTDVPAVFVYKTQTPLRWHKVQNKGCVPSRRSCTAVAAVSALLN